MPLMGNYAERGKITGGSPERLKHLHTINYCQPLEIKERNHRDSNKIRKEEERNQNTPISTPVLATLKLLSIEALLHSG